MKEAPNALKRHVRRPATVKTSRCNSRAASTQVALCVNGTKTSIQPAREMELGIWARRCVFCWGARFRVAWRWLGLFRADIRKLAPDESSPCFCESFSRLNQLERRCISWLPAIGNGGFRFSRPVPPEQWPLGQRQRTQHRPVIAPFSKKRSKNLSFPGWGETGLR